MKLLVNFFYVLTLFPAYSILQNLIKIYISNRFISLILFPILIYNKKIWKVDKALLPVIGLLLFFFIFFIFSLIDNRESLIYFGYVVAFIYIIMSYYIVRYYEQIFLSYMKSFLVINFIYVVFQIICLNIGLNSYAMIHTNLPAQLNYTIPIFITEPFYRYTGLFNESSPFIFYLIITFIFFSSLGKNYDKYKRISFMLIIFSGAKVGYLFLILHYAFFSKNLIFRLFLKGIFITFISLFFYNYEYLSSLFDGQTASLNQRMNSLFNINELTLLGVNIGKSSEGDLGLNYLSIILNGFGIFGMIFSFVMFLLFFTFLKTKTKRYYIFPFILGLLSNGSLLIFQYALLFAMLFYLNKRRI